MNNHTTELAAGTLATSATLSIGTTRTALDAGNLINGEFVYTGNEWTYTDPIPLTDFTLDIDINRIPAVDGTATLHARIAEDYTPVTGKWHPGILTLNYHAADGTILDSRSFALIVQSQSETWDEGPITQVTLKSIETLSQNHSITNTNDAGSVITSLTYDGYISSVWRQEVLFGILTLSIENDVLPVGTFPQAPSVTYDVPEAAFNVLDLAILFIQNAGMTPFPNLEPGRVAQFQNSSGLTFKIPTIAALDAVPFERTGSYADLTPILLPGSSREANPEEFANDLIVTQTWEAATGTQTKISRYRAAGHETALPITKEWAEETKPNPSDTSRFQAMVNRWAARAYQVTLPMLPAYWLDAGDPITSPLGLGHIRSISHTPTGTIIHAIVTRTFSGWPGGPRWQDQTITFTQSTTTWQET